MRWLRDCGQGVRRGRRAGSEHAAAAAATAGRVCGGGGGCDGGLGVRQHRGGGQDVRR